MNIRAAIRRYARPAGLITVGFVFGVTVASAARHDTPTTVQAGAVATTTTTTAAPTTTTTAAPTTTTTAAPTTTTAAPKWVRVFTMTGTANKTSAPFTLSGTQARIHYTCDGYRPGVDPTAVACSFYLKQPGALPSAGEAEHHGTGSDVSSLYVDPGQYYIEANTANSNWSLWVEDLRKRASAEAGRTSPAMGP